jgi:hypothetical protein
VCSPACGAKIPGATGFMTQTIAANPNSKRNAERMILFHHIERGRMRHKGDLALKLKAME